VKLDLSIDGGLDSFKLEAGKLAPHLLSAKAIGSKVGLLYESTVPNSQGPSLDYAEFAITDVNGAATTATNLSTEGNGSSILWFRLDVTPLGAWLGLGMLHNPGGSFWLTTAGSNLAPWSNPDPPLVEDQFSATVVDNTLMLTGGSCSSRSGCTPTFSLQRYSATSLSSVGSMITLSQNTQTSLQKTSTTMGTVGSEAALFWTEVQSPGQLYRALIKADGTFAHPVDTVQSAISPRAILQSPLSGSLLVGVITTGASYQLVGQRLDSNLGLIGNPLPIAAAQSADVTGIEVHPSPDGSQVLVTYRQAGARYRLLGTNLCGG